MDKLDLILNLVRENKITNEEAKTLLKTEKEYIKVPNTIPTSSPFNWPPQKPIFYENPYKITCAKPYEIGKTYTTNTQQIN